LDVFSEHRVYYHRFYLHLFLIVFLNCYSAIRLLSHKCEIKLSSAQFNSMHTRKWHIDCRVSNRTHICDF